MMSVDEALMCSFQILQASDQKLGRYSSSILPGNHFLFPMAEDKDKAAAVPGGGMGEEEVESTKERTWGSHRSSAASSAALSNGRRSGQLLGRERGLPDGSGPPSFRSPSPPIKANSRSSAVPGSVSEMDGEVPRGAMGMGQGDAAGGPLGRPEVGKEGEEAAMGSIVSKHVSKIDKVFPGAGSKAGKSGGAAPGGQGGGRIDSPEEEEEEEEEETTQWRSTWLPGARPRGGDWLRSGRNNLGQGSLQSSFTSQELESPLGALAITGGGRGGAGMGKGDSGGGSSGGYGSLDHGGPVAVAMVEEEDGAENFLHHLSDDSGGDDDSVDGSTMGALEGLSPLHSNSTRASIGGGGSGGPGGASSSYSSSSGSLLDMKKSDYLVHKQKLAASGPGLGLAPSPAGAASGAGKGRGKGTRAAEAVETEVGVGVVSGIAGSGSRRNRRVGGKRVDGVSSQDGVGCSAPPPQGGMEASSST
ncbi:unnamed protein product, partial [Discosporangium mesarthrocarpum]